MDWAGLISQVGFPIAVSVWLLARLDNRLGAFEKTAVAICQRLEDRRTVATNAGNGADTMRQENNWGQSPIK